MTNSSETDQADRDRKVMRAVAWTGAGRYLGQLFRWSSTLVVARILSPNDYGLVGMTTLFSGMVSLLAEFGVGAVVLRIRDLDDTQVDQLNGLSILLGFFAFLLGLVAAWPLSSFFNRRELVGIVAVSSLGFVLTAFQTVPSSILQRDLRFREVASIEFISSVILAVGVLTMALLGFGYWSLVIPNLIVASVTSLRLQRLVSIRLTWPRLSRLQEAYRYSLWVIFGRLSSYVFFSADFLMVGRLLGSAPLGAYTFAWDLANTPNDQISGLVARVSTPFFSTLQGDRSELARLFRKLLEGISIVSIPLILGLASVAPEFVKFALGDKWIGAVPVLQILCVFSSLRVLTILVGPLLVMLGDARFQANVTFVALLYMPFLFYLGAERLGAPGVAIAWLVGYPPVIFALFFRAAQHCGLTLRDLVHALSPVFWGSIAMVLCVSLCRSLLPVDYPLALRLTALVIAGAATYVCTLLFVFRDRVVGFYNFLRATLSRSPQEA